MLMAKTGSSPPLVTALVFLCSTEYIYMYTQSTCRSTCTHRAHAYCSTVLAVCIACMQMHSARPRVQHTTAYGVLLAALHYILWGRASEENAVLKFLQWSCTTHNCTDTCVEYIQRTSIQLVQPALQHMTLWLTVFWLYILSCILAYAETHVLNLLARLWQNGWCLKQIYRRSVAFQVPVFFFSSRMT